MKPFTFGQGNVRDEWQRFTSEAAKWKPSGYDQEMALRLRYYLDQQLEDTKGELVKRFPETGTDMHPVVLPITRHLIRETAKVFLSTTKLDLVDDGEPLEATKNEDGTEEPHELVAWWERTKERMGLTLRLKRVDAYTHLMRTCFLRPGHEQGKRFTAHVVFPHALRVVMDPAAPMDLDRAYGVAVEIASEAGLSDGARRWEFFCAREGDGETPQRLILEEGKRGDEEVVTVVEQDEGDPLRAPDGRAVVPLVPFMAHTEELGLFTMEGSDLVPMNRGLNVLVSDIVNIAEQQGFGVMVVETQAGSKAPAKIIRSPNTAISPGEGNKVSFINPNAPIADLVALAQARLKMHAMLYGIPPGSVSLEARAVASGIALQIELRPLAESRQDQVDCYRDSMRRLWDVIWATFNAYADDANAPVKKLPETLEMRWTPGELQVPVDEGAKVDNILARLKSKLISRIEAIAADRGISLEEAREVAKRIDAEAATEPRPEPEDDPLGLRRKREELNADPDDEDPEEPEEPAAPAA